MLRQLGLAQIKDSVGTHSREFVRVGHFIAFLTKWTEAGRWGGAKRPEGKNQAISQLEAGLLGCICRRWGSLQWGLGQRGCRGK